MDKYEEFDNEEFEDEDYDEMIESVVFVDEDGNDLEFYILDVVEYKNNIYLLVVDNIDEDDDEVAEATILKEIEVEEDDFVYEMVEDDEEFNQVAEVFDRYSEDYELDI